MVHVCMISTCWTVLVRMCVQHNMDILYYTISHMQHKIGLYGVWFYTYVFLCRKGTEYGSNDELRISQSETYHEMISFVSSTDVPTHQDRKSTATIWNKPNNWLGSEALILYPSQVDLEVLLKWTTKLKFPKS